MRFLPLLFLVFVGVNPLVAAADGGEDPPASYTSPSMLRASILYAEAPKPPSHGMQQVGSARSIPLAFGMSAVVPGLGQAYNRQWIKAALGVGLEAAIIWGYTTSRARGLDGRDAYQAYAHEYWSPLRYADWLNEYAEWLETDPIFEQRPWFGTDFGTVTIPDLLQDAGFDVTNPEAWSLEERRAINDLFRQIRDMEGAIVHPETGASFSHKLPGFSEQQYYELIGKYYQFAPGWTDYPDYLNEEGEPIDERMDPERTGEDDSKPNVSDRFFQYAEDHGQANDYLRRASRISMLFIVNHLVAAVDAAVFAKLHNDRLDTNLSFRPGPGGDVQPVASVRFRF